MADKQKVKSVFRVIGNVLLYLLLGICLFTVVLTILTKRDSDGAATMLGYQMRVIQSPSMEKSEQTWDEVKEYDITDLPVRSLIFIKVVPEDEQEAYEWYGDIEVGDVLTFKYEYASEQPTITHRVTDIFENGEGGYTITLEGDNQGSEEYPYQTMEQIIHTQEGGFSYVIGKVVSKSNALGLFMYALKSPAGIICLIILPCVIVIVMEVLRIVHVLGEEKREKAKEAEKQKDDELAELRRRLAQLEGNLPPEPPAENTTPQTDADGAQSPSDGSPTDENNNS